MHGNSLGNYEAQMDKYWSEMEDKTKSILKMVKEHSKANGWLFNEKVVQWFKSRSDARIEQCFTNLLADIKFKEQMTGTTFSSSTPLYEHEDGQPNVVSSQTPSFETCTNDDSGTETSTPKDFPSQDDADSAASSGSIEANDQALGDFFHAMTSHPMASSTLLHEMDPTESSSKTQRPLKRKNTDELNTIGDSAAKKRRMTLRSALKVIPETPPSTDTSSSLSSSGSSKLDDQQPASSDMVKSGSENLGTSTGIRKTVTPNRKLHKCDICEKVLKTNRILQDHHNSFHSNVLFPFQCAVCNHGFKDEERKKLHENGCKKKRYVCELCQYSTFNLSHMRYHMRTHTGEKQFQCNGCGRRFSLKGNLNTHVNVCPMNKNSFKRDTL